MKNVFKSIGAVVAGFLSVVILSVATDFLLETLGIFPPQTNPGAYVTWMLVFALFYRSVYALVGGYVTARLAPGRAMRHVVVLGVLGIAGGTAGVIAGWSLGAHWYPIALAVSAFPLTWFGGKMYTKKELSR